MSWLLHHLVLLFPVAVAGCTMFWDTLTPFQRDCLKVAWGAALVILLTHREWTDSGSGN